MFFFLNYTIAMIPLMAFLKRRFETKDWERSTPIGDPHIQNLILSLMKRFKHGNGRTHIVSEYEDLILLG